MKHKILAYADDIAVLESNLEDIERLARTLLKEAEKIGLQVNVDKTKYMIVSRNSHPNSMICVDSKSFSKVDRFKYLGSTITSIND